MHIANTSSLFRYKVGFRRSGKDIWLTNWKNNLILDSGLNQIAVVAWASAFDYCLFGDQVSPTPVSRNSGAVNFTVIGTACTASGSFFLSSDAGRLMKFDGVGGEYYIQTYNSPTSVTLASVSSPAITAETATIWYVNQTQLEHLFSTTNLYSSAGGGANGTTDIGNTRTMQRTYIGNALVAPATLTEIGFNSSASNANIFDRDIITGGLGLIAGDQPLAVAQLVLTLNPSTLTAAANNATGYDNSGNYQLCDCFTSYRFVDTSGNSNGQNALEPSVGGGNFRLCTATFTIPAFGTGGTPPSVSVFDSTTSTTYISGSFFTDSVGTWNIGTATGNFYGFLFDRPGGGGSSWMHLLTTPTAKTSGQKLTCTFRKSWQRILVN